MGFSASQAADDEPTKAEVLRENLKRPFSRIISNSLAVLDDSREEASLGLIDLMFAVRHHEWNGNADVDRRNNQALNFHAKKCVSLQARYTKNVIAHDELLKSVDELVDGIMEGMK